MADVTARAKAKAAAAQAKNIKLREAAEWYGVSERTLRRRIAEGRLRAYRIGPRAIRVSVEDLEAMAKPIGFDGGTVA